MDTDVYPPFPFVCVFASGVIANYPKRTDAWHVFIDLEIKVCAGE